VCGNARMLTDWDLLGMEAAIHFRGVVRHGQVLRIGIYIHLNALIIINIIITFQFTGTDRRELQQALEHFYYRVENEEDLPNHDDGDDSDDADDDDDDDTE
jgi:hypothetical protein